MYHFVCPAKYRRVVFDKNVDEVLKETCLEIEKRCEMRFFGGRHRLCGKLLGVGKELPRLVLRLAINHMKRGMAREGNLNDHWHKIMLQ
jgi:hypothetical protein